MGSHRDVARVTALLTRGLRADSADVKDAADLAQYLTKVTAADLRRLGNWIYFDGDYDEKVFENVIRRLELEDPNW